MTELSFIHRSCPICGSDRSTEEVRSGRKAEALSPQELRPFWSGLFKEKVFFSYDRCGDCGVLFAPDFFGEAELAELYASMAPNMDDVPVDSLEATQNGYFDAAARGAKLRGGYLELGPDVGYLARRAAELGAFDHFWLFEPNRAVHAQLADAVGDRPHTILGEMTDLSVVPDGSVGLAVMVHVLDHLLDPMAMLRQCRAKLRPGGTILIVTHNEASLLRRAMGRRWPPFCLQHPQLYSPASTRRMLERAGFKDVRVARSKNYFPVDFLIRQAAWAMKVRLDALPLPKTALGLRLGNMITLATC